MQCALLLPEFADQLTWSKCKDIRPILRTDLPRLIKDASYSVAAHLAVTADLLEKTIQSWFKKTYRKLRREMAVLRRINKNQWLLYYYYHQYIYIFARMQHVVLITTRLVIR
ncbi:hypothetical protein CSKR_204087 [Clonorchis sinensis]|uniref:Uncharacterized protein n=1 Tax=Clonorchis sinensis TaxID=79923 RepID=A0A8T1M778_CLOSI|nr:hypothetical protein CSKR_204087 [Clonorchis sinensis]